MCHQPTYTPNPHFKNKKVIWEYSGNKGTARLCGISTSIGDSTCPKIYIPRRRFLSGLIATSALYLLSPVLSAARSMEPQRLGGLTVTTNIERVEEYSFDTHKLIYVKTRTHINEGRQGTKRGGDTRLRV